MASNVTSADINGSTDDRDRQEQNAAGGAVLRRKTGFEREQAVDFRASGGVITITPIMPIMPTANHEYTPEQTRIIDAELAEALKGPFHGPFDTADEMVVHIKGQLKKTTVKKPKRSR